MEEKERLAQSDDKKEQALSRMTIDGHSFKEVNTEQAMKLDNALNFTEHLGNSSDSVRRS
ncbi:MAG: hypothetical protein ACUZ9M_08205 [Candidatus Scalindua sp.]